MRRCAAVGCDGALAPALADPAVGRIAATAASTATLQMAEPRARRAIGPGPEAIDIDRTTSPQARSGRQRYAPQDVTPVSGPTRETRLPQVLQSAPLPSPARVGFEPVRARLIVVRCACAIPPRPAPPARLRGRPTARPLRTGAAVTAHPAA